MEIFYFEQSIHKCYPKLRIESMLSIPGGDDFHVFEVNRNLIFRFAKTLKEVEKLKTELSNLKHLGIRLPVQIPNPTYINLAGYSQNFVGYTKIEGVPFSMIGTKNSIANAGKQIAIVLSVLNTIKCSDHHVNRIYQNRWQKYFWNMLSTIKKTAFGILPYYLRKEFEFVLSKVNWQTLIFSISPSLIHSDIRSCHVLCDKNNEVMGLIDWSDSTYGDIAFDFARILNEFGIEFLMTVKANLTCEIKIQFNRIAFYALLLPFLDILRGLNCKDIKRLNIGIEKLEYNLHQYSSYTNINL